jgi:hypothetical protein
MSKVIEEKEKLPQLKGTYRIRRYVNVRSVKYTKKGIVVDGDFIDEVKFTNVFTTIGKQLTLKLLGKKIGVTGLEYIALGTGAAASTTDLDTERVRETVGFYSDPSGSEVFMVFSAYLGPDTPGTTYTFTEIGIFGNGATAVVDSGDMLASNGISPGVQKETGLHSLIVDYTLSY